MSALTTQIFPQSQLLTRLARFAAAASMHWAAWSRWMSPVPVPTQQEHPDRAASASPAPCIAAPAVELKPPVRSLSQEVSSQKHSPRIAIQIRIREIGSATRPRQFTILGKSQSE